VIDTHCHLLPGVDDGPQDATESTRLAEALAAAGVTRVVCTPHVSRRWPTTRSRAEAALSEIVALGGLDVDLAAEFSPALLLEADSDVLEGLAIGGSFVLVELKPDTAGDFVRVASDYVGRAGLRIVFAHPERCRAVQRAVSIVDAIRDGGGLVQIVSSSLAGVWGDTTERTAWTLLSSGRADVLASDAHQVRDAERLVGVLAELEDRLGTEAARRLTQSGPAALLGG